MNRVRASPSRMVSIIRFSGQAAGADFIVIFVTHRPRTNYSASCQVSGAGGMRNQICEFEAKVFAGIYSPELIAIISRY